MCGATVNIVLVNTSTHFCWGTPGKGNTGS